MTPPPISPTHLRPWTRCRICRHVWFLLDPVVKPRDCPGCKSALWAPEHGAWRRTALPSRLPKGVAVALCARCGHLWFVRDRIVPVRCPSPACRSPYWHRPRQQAA